jgi:hypothetical protein
MDRGIGPSCSGRSILLKQVGCEARKTPAVAGVFLLIETAVNLVGAVGIELLINFTKSHVFTVLPTADQMNWSQMELNAVSNGLHI